MMKIKYLISLLLVGFIFAPYTEKTDSFAVNNIQRSCETKAWSRQVDGLPSPAFPERNETGDEFVLIGIVRDAETCQPISDATVMFDMTNADGEYDGVHQGTTYTSPSGFFVIRSGRPGAYAGGPAHIHLFIGAPGHETITAGYNLTNDKSWGWVKIALVTQEA